MAGNDKEEIEQIKQALNQTLKIKGLGNLRYLLGFEITKSKKWIMINQRKYALELLTNAGLLACKPAPTRIDNHAKSSSTRSVPFPDVQDYRRLIGKLMYLSNVQPDIRFYVQQLSQFLVEPTIVHYNATIRVLKEFRVLVFFFFHHFCSFNIILW